MFDPAAYSTIIANRLIADAEGAPTRALLGAGAASIISVAALNEPHPPRPFVAFKSGQVVQLDRVLRNASWLWYLYDDPPQYDARIDQLAGTISQAYLARLLDTPNGGSLNDPPYIFLGQTFTDPVLGLRCRSVQLTYTLF